jgi:hypothetical protein
MIYVFEVGYKRNGVSLPPCIVDVMAENPNDAKDKLEKEKPNGMGIRKATLIGSRKT